MTDKKTSEPNTAEVLAAEPVETVETNQEASEQSVLEAAKAEIKVMLAKASEEAAKIVADAKQAAQSVESTKPPNQDEQEAYLNEYVEIQLFQDNGKYKDDVFVAVNGETCLIKRGMPVKVKRKFAQLIDSGQRQDLYAAQLAEQYANDYREKQSALT